MTVGALLLAGSLTAAQASEKHLFYVHGCCINKVGGGGYETIVQELRKAGYNVRFDLRQDDSETEVKAYAARIAGQVKDLIAKGAPPENITVSGFSLGSVTALYAAIEIANPKVNLVLLAGCPGKGARQFDIDYAKVQGRSLSILDAKDDRFGSCKGRLPDSVLQKEVVFDSGKGHAVFRLPDEQYRKLWMSPLVEWSKIN